jgi:DNA repair exonuclease SbcCD ATPase subunit
MVSSCPTLLDNSRASGALTSMTSRVTKAQTTRASVVAMLQKATTQSAGMEGQMMATTQMIAMQVKFQALQVEFQALSNKSSQAHSKAERLEEYVDEMEKQIVFSDLSESRLEKVEALLARKQKNLEDAKEEESVINAQLEQLQTSMVAAMPRVVHSKKRKVSENKENVTDVELIDMDNYPNGVGATKRKIFRDSEIESDSDSVDFPAAYKA